MRLDLRDREAVHERFAQRRPEIVFHLAAQSLVRRSYVAPVDTFAVNVLGTAHVLEAACRTESVRALVVVTTDKCYENREWCWGYREIDRLGGHDPYSASKACAELLTASWRRSFASEHRPAIATARAGNVIGGGDWARDRLLPDCVRAFAAGKPVTLRRPHAVRPWQHVLEPLAAYLLLAERLVESPEQAADAWNFGPAAEDVRTVREVVERAAALWGKGAHWEIDPDAASAPHEASALALDCAKARTRLGWRPRTDFATALASTIEWYRAHHEGACARALCERQIEAFWTEQM